MKAGGAWQLMEDVRRKGRRPNAFSSGIRRSPRVTPSAHGPALAGPRVEMKELVGGPAPRRSSRGVAASRRRVPRAQVVSSRIVAAALRTTGS
jgi:hypothetical protein